MPILHSLHTPTFDFTNVEANSVVELYLSDTATTPLNDSNLSLLALAESSDSVGTVSVTVGDNLTTAYTPSVSGDSVDATLIKIQVIQNFT